jgi:hypothetical protein
MFSSDVVVSAGGHSLEDFEPELARVSSEWPILASDSMMSGGSSDVS